MRGIVLLVIAVGAGTPAGQAVTLIARTTSVASFVPVKRETWTLRIDEADHATLERVQEDAELPAAAPGPKPRLEEAARRGEELSKQLKWKPTLDEKYEGTVKRGTERFLVKAGTVTLDCSRRKLPVHPADARLGLPAHAKGCGDIKLTWLARAAPKQLEVTRCMLQGGEDSLDSQLTFAESPGVDHVIEEDDCAVGDGYRLAGPEGR